MHLLFLHTFARPSNQHQHAPSEPGLKTIPLDSDIKRCHENNLISQAKRNENKRLRGTRLKKGKYSSLFHQTKVGASRDSFCWSFTTSWSSNQREITPWRRLHGYSYEAQPLDERTLYLVQWLVELHWVADICVTSPKFYFNLSWLKMNFQRLHSVSVFCSSLNSFFCCT